jgi:hypothetical protein
MKKYIVVLICISSICCKKDSTQMLAELFDKEIQNLVLPLGVARDSLYFTGIFNGKQVAISNGVDNYKVFGGPTPFYIGNSIVLNDTNSIKGFYNSFWFDHLNPLSKTDELYKPKIIIDAPLEDKHLTGEAICDRAFILGDKKIRSFRDSEQTGYEIKLTFNYQFVGGGYNTLGTSSAAGYQSTDSKLNIDEVVKMEFSDRFVYLVKGRLTCQLFASFNSNYPRRLVFDVKDGRFSQRVEAFK